MPPPLILSFTNAHLCETPSCNVSRDNCAIPILKKSTREVGNTIATSIARYEKNRYWAPEPLDFVLVLGPSGEGGGHPDQSFSPLPLKNYRAHPLQNRLGNAFCADRNPMVIVPFRKIPAPIKIKSALPPPPEAQNTPPKTRNFMDMEVFLQKERKFQAPVKLAHPFPAPELRTKILRKRGNF